MTNATDIINEEIVFDPEVPEIDEFKDDPYPYE